MALGEEIEHPQHRVNAMDHDVTRLRTPSIDGIQVHRVAIPRPCREVVLGCRIEVAAADIMPVYQVLDA